MTRKICKETVCSGQKIHQLYSLIKKPGFWDADIHKDNLYDTLFQIQNDELDGLALVALEIVMSYFCLTVARQMEEVLQGKLHNPSEELRNEVAMAPTANSVSERVFGSFDRYNGRNPMLTHWTWKVQYYLKQTKLPHGLMAWILLSKICIWTWLVNQQKVL